MLRLKRYKIKKPNHIINVLFYILPIIDTLNGIFESFPIGKVYKFSLIILLLMNNMKHKSIYRKYVTFFSIALVYVTFSVLINVFLGGKVGNVDYPVKLIFNLLLLLAMMQSFETEIMKGMDIFEILDVTSWIFIMCYLIPYILGVGNNVYLGGIGYKAFFIAQNELGIIIVVFTFFVVYNLSKEVRVSNIIKLGLLFFCGILLNTKTTIVACLVAVAFWIIPIVLKGDGKFKIITFLSSIVGFLIIKDKLVSNIMLAVSRFNRLTSMYYNDSVLSGLLSGRNYYVYAGWNENFSENIIVHFFFGNGFCSDYLTEMDFVDIFLYLGIVGFIGTCLMLLWIYKKIKSNSQQSFGKTGILSFWVIISIMFFAGHVLFMSMSGCFFIIYICFLVYYRNEYDRKSKG